MEKRKLKTKQTDSLEGNDKDTSDVPPELCGGLLKSKLERRSRTLV